MPYRYKEPQQLAVGVLHQAAARGSHALGYGISLHYISGNPAPQVGSTYDAVRSWPFAHLCLLADGGHMRCLPHHEVLSGGLSGQEQWRGMAALRRAQG